MRRTWVLAFILGSVSALAEPAAPAVSLSSLAVWRDRIVALDARCAPRAWDAETLELDADFAKRLATRKLTALASEGDALYATDGNVVWQWDADGESWTRPQPVSSKEGALQRFVAGPRGALLVFEGGVFDAHSRRWFARPQESASDAGVEMHTAKVFQNQLWMGGEDAAGAGHLWVLDLSQGRWKEHVDDLRYPTGISYGLTGTVVSWSKAGSQLVVHGVDGSAAGTLFRSEQANLQNVTFNPFDRALYGVDQKKLLRISRGRYEPIAELTAGVRELRVVNADTFALGCSDGNVLLVREGKVKRLAAK